VLDRKPLATPSCIRPSTRPMIRAATQDDDLKKVCFLAIVGEFNRMPPGISLMSCKAKTGYHHVERRVRVLRVGTASKPLDVGVLKKTGIGCA
jgi:hypothetical protein